MLTTIAYSIMAFLLLRWSVVLYNLLHPAYLASQTPSQFPLISILIPVRNEEANIAPIMQQINQLQYPRLEVFFLNDHSTDNTEEQLRMMIWQYPYASYSNSQPLPVNWLGKNWACHQLAKYANGKYLIFMDADIVSLDERLLSISVSAMQTRKLSMLSIFPDQIMETKGEKFVVPLMHYILLSLLPMWWILKSKLIPFSAANGQFLMFEAQSYQKHQWHKRVHNKIIEDIGIMRSVKRAGLKGMSYLGSGLIRCRMYRSYVEGLRGFSKNILAGFGNSIPALWIYMGIIIPGELWASWMLPWAWGLFALVLILSLKGMIAYLARQNIWENLLYHPLQMLSMLWISGISTRNKIIGKNEWKGRNVQLQ
ncbi:MAG: glycosyltransferase family 2 protein [Bacteroidota bacterium]